MRNLVLTGLLLLLCSAWVVAQTGGSSGSSGSGASASGASSQAGSTGQAGGATGSSGSSMDSNANQTSIQGCLSGSSGSYTLTDNSGATYQLQGSDSKLSKHVGEEVEVKGSEGSSSAASSASPSGASPSSSASSGASSSSGASAGKSFNVTSVKKISSTCGSSKTK